MASKGEFTVTFSKEWRRSALTLAILVICLLGVASWSSVYASDPENEPSVPQFALQLRASQEFQASVSGQESNPSSEKEEMKSVNYGAEILPHKQIHSLSCEAAIVGGQMIPWVLEYGESHGFELDDVPGGLRGLTREQLAAKQTRNWLENEVIKWVPVQLDVQKADPNKEFMGNVDGDPKKGDYGVHAEPLVIVLNERGIPVESRYTPWSGDGSKDALKEWYDQAYGKLVKGLQSGPVMVWKTGISNSDFKYPETSRPQPRMGEHVWLIYGVELDKDGKPEKFYMSDPGTGKNFEIGVYPGAIPNWHLFDGMLLQFGT